MNKLLIVPVLLSLAALPAVAGDVSPAVVIKGDCPEGRVMVRYEYLDELDYPIVRPKTPMPPVERCMRTAPGLQVRVGDRVLMELDENKWVMVSSLDKSAATTASR